VRDTSITVTGHVQKAAWRNKVLPPVEQVRENVWSIPVPFPKHPMRYTLSYLLTGGDDAILVDPGWASDEGWRHLVAGLARAGFGLSDLTGIVVTHRHADHLGLAARVREASGAWVALGENERLGLPAESEVIEWLAADLAGLELWGVPVDRRHEIALGERWLSTQRTLAEPDLRLADGAVVPASGSPLRILETPGHTAGHICLVDESNGLIFSGDHVLPRISPNVSFHALGPVNPLADYYQSLERIGFDDEMEACPAHEYRFRGMRRRVNELLADGRGRSEEVLRIVADASAGSIWEIARRLSWSRGWESLQGPPLRLALAETAAHVVYLESCGYDIGVLVHQERAVWKAR
jgi:glyoxylase-like metal-dependent hydrolase (beta-lactamase superfamily II)